jgi:methylenetetrahydrofolate reductase (NADPH)
MSANGVAEVRAIAAARPPASKVYVNHLPGHSVAVALPTLVALREHGLEPVPHIAARRLASRDEVRSFVERAVAEADVTTVLVVGGDDREPLGPYADGAALLREGVLAQCGVRAVALPGYPDGHPHISTTVLEQDLRTKLELAAAQGVGTYLVTQFCFAPSHIVAHCAWLAREFPLLPVYVGLAGPTELRALLRFARRCGVRASWRALRDQRVSAVRLATQSDPSDQLAAVVQYCEDVRSSNVVGVHLFCFGGTERTLSWMRTAAATS